MSQHLCSVPGCGRQIGTEFLMCLPHWRQVPPRSRAYVREAWRHYQSGLIELEVLRATQAEATAAVVEGGVA